MMRSRRKERRNPRRPPKEGMTGRIPEVIRAFRAEARRRGDASVTRQARRRDPYRVLVSCVISVRTRDEVTAEASRRLFRIAPDVRSLSGKREETVARTIFPAGFYRRKARHLREMARQILRRFGGRVPDRMEDLLSLPGVGRKTANLVITLGHGKPGICVDTHVHRISNRLGLCATARPDDTEAALREVLPGRYWIEFNNLLVTYGRAICTPISPRCSACRVADLCPRVGVGRSR